jgi:hypothetical protein
MEKFTNCSPGCRGHCLMLAWVFLRNTPTTPTPNPVVDDRRATPLITSESDEDEGYYWQQGR